MTCLDLEMLTRKKHIQKALEVRIKSRNLTICLIGYLNGLLVLFSLHAKSFSQVQAEQEKKKNGVQLLKQTCSSHVGHNDRKHKQVTTASLWVCITRSKNFLAF